MQNKLEGIFATAKIIQKLALKEKTAKNLNIFFMIK